MLFTILCVIELAGPGRYQFGPHKQSIKIVLTEAEAQDLQKILDAPKPGTAVFNELACENLQDTLEMASAQ